MPHKQTVILQVTYRKELKKMPISFETVTMHRFRCKECDLESYEAVGLGELVYTLSVHLQIRHKIPYPRAMAEAKKYIRELPLSDEVLDNVN